MPARREPSPGRAVRLRPILPALFALVLGIAAPSAQEAGASPAPRRVLTASLYPYIPNAEAAYFRLEEAFERAHPEIDLRIHLLSEAYYDHRPDRASLVNDRADVYEIDSVFLADVIASGKIAPLGNAPDALDPGLVPLARDVVVREGRVWGMPHWLCGNFLFHRTDDAAMRGVRTLADLEAALTAAAQPDWLVADFAGTSTLGELYLDAVMDATGSPGPALDRVMRPGLDPEIVASMSRAVMLLRPLLGRDEDYHNRTGLHARQFARNAGRALVGYSEQLFHLLSETARSCRRDEGCLRAEDIAVAEWPLASAGSSPIAWVDVLAIDASATGPRRADAETFVAFMTRPETYRLFLMPAWPDPPRYLLPAREDLYADPDLLREAPLYPELRARIGHATPLTGLGLNARLREIGALLKAALPAR